ncbi:hypothetical protein BN59_03206 [Legionella massiliensis]|uniref:Neurogenic locus notch like protein n=1 Tax=Legionella massiliensis TaxID=1034943 RepID=A0A078L144_9GAMM|nr:hypothetical protein [Legionella massiliensis]CDZ78891.1 hypothetical protein BN59_03206 [Legionella massiliensis]CEE14629.1 hypothetical protein BN1094_03206 [Legionella massiliensis]
MRSLFYSLVTVVLILIHPIAANAQSNDPACTETFLPTCDKHFCCGDMGGISYCDSSAGRYVCNNGYYSSCYCNRHAVMNLQKLEGCCLWQGGVLTVADTGAVICNNGSVSEVCSLQNPTQQVSSW